MTFPAAIADAMPPDDGLRVGTVVTTSPLIVSVQGQYIPMGRLASYTPVAGHVVGVFRQDSTWLCLGQIL